MIKELFLEGELNREKICTKYFISQATFSRNKSKLKKMLRIFEFELTTNNCIAGKEHMIRNFFFMFFSYATSEWLFSENAYVSLEESMTSGFLDNLDPAKKSLMRLLLYISKVRNIQGYSIDTSTTIAFEENSNYEHFYKDIANYVEKNFPYIEKKIEEIQFIFFFSIRVKLIVPDIYQEENLLVDTDQIEKLDKSNVFLTKLILDHFLREMKSYVPLFNKKCFLFCCSFILILLI
ncbi:hypothetical protein ATZ33_08345 [Enterococcus silesiacus]|nr:hypothetical protein ATZ33_08345 [Enterococcus silesiacus]